MKACLFAVGFMGVCSLGVAQSSEPLQVRWGTEGRALMAVMGIDAQDRLRLAASDGSSGKALVPMSDLKDL